MAQPPFRRMIDAYAHFLPVSYYDRLLSVAPDKAGIKRWLNLPVLWDLDARIAMMGRWPGYQQIVTLSSPPIESIASPADAPELAALANDEMGEIHERRPDLFPGWVASLPMNSPADAVKEIDRAFTMPGCLGVQIFTNVAGRPLDQPEYRPIFAEMERRDRPIWMHPARPARFADYVAEEQSEYEIWWAFGWPYESSAAMARLVFSGIMLEHPRIKIITHHMGGMIPFFEGRIGLGWDQLGSRTPGDELSTLLASMPARPVDYFRRFYADTALSGSLSGTRCGLDFFGVDHVVFGTDCPFDPDGGPLFIDETIGVIEKLGLSEDDRERIYSGNVSRISGLVVG